jgi:DNA-binding NarL/FixJ family response regulator
MADSPLHIIHLEDDPADAERVARELARAGLQCTIRLVNTKDDFVRAVAEFEPAVVLSDHARADFNARAALSYLQEHRPTTPLIVVTGAITEQLIVDYIKAGAADYVIKSNLGRLRPAIEVALLARQRLERLTPRQIEVLRLLAEGRSTAEAAKRLGLSVKTVETHRMAIMDRLGIHELAGLVRFAIHVGLVSLELPDREIPVGQERTAT